MKHTDEQCTEVVNKVLAGGEHGFDFTDIADEIESMYAFLMVHNLEQKKIEDRLLSFGYDLRLVKCFLAYTNKVDIVDVLNFIFSIFKELSSRLGYSSFQHTFSFEHLKL